LRSHSITRITITPTTQGAREVFFVGTGIRGTAVFVRSWQRARTVREVLEDEARGTLTAAERWDVINALLNDDEVDALKASASCQHVATWQGITMPSGYCAKCGAGPHVVPSGGR
jgi:hypothetical protein